MHEQKRDHSGSFVHIEIQLQDICVWYVQDLPWTFEEVEATLSPFFGDSRCPSMDGGTGLIITTETSETTIKTSVNCQQELSTAIGHEKRWEFICSIWLLNEQLGMKAPENGLDGLNLKENKLQVHLRVSELEAKLSAWQKMLSRSNCWLWS